MFHQQMQQQQSQLSYAEQAPAVAGQIADLTDATSTDTYVQGEASASVPFGAMVAETTVQTTTSVGSGAGGTPAIAKLPAASTDRLAGVVVFNHEYDKRLQLDAVGVKPGNLISVINKGRVWVNTEVAVAIGDDVYARYTANGPLLPGGFRNDADTAKAAQIKGARFLTATAGAGLVEIEIDMAAHRAGGGK